MTEGNYWILRLSPIIVPISQVSSGTLALEIFKISMIYDVRSKRYHVHNAHERYKVFNALL